MTDNSLPIRPATDSDGDQIANMIELIFAEYPGCHFVRDEFPELAHPATAFTNENGVLWVIDRDGLITGCVGVVRDRSDSSLFELRKLYLRQQERGKGIAIRLIDMVESHARAHGGDRVHLWSDTRFERAHHVYFREGYTKHNETRELRDVSNTVEYHFSKQIVLPPFTKDG